MASARWLLGSLLAAACGGDRAEPRPRSPDKAALFGDATLVPTREGEAARAELAAAGEVAAALRAGGWLDPLHVDVEHDGAARRVVVSGRRTATAPDDLDARVLAIVDAICGPSAVVLAIAAAPAAPAPRGLDLPLGLALLGLGASVALTAQRLWLRRRRALRRPRGGSLRA